MLIFSNIVVGYLQNMTRSFFSISLLFFMIFSWNSLAQKQQKLAFEEAKYCQFAFWEGNWKVFNQKGKYINRTTWIKNNNNTISQIWKHVNTKGQSISKVFRGIYKRDV